jgi:hypothetical protein
MASLVQRATSGRSFDGLNARSRTPSELLPPWSHDRDDLLDGRRVSRIPLALVSRSAALMKAGRRDRRPAMTGRVIQNGLHLALLPELVSRPSIVEVRSHLRFSDSGPATARRIDATLCRISDPGVRQESGATVVVCGFPARLPVHGEATMRR